jgi:hypothetical protein
MRKRFADRYAIAGYKAANIFTPDELRAVHVCSRETLLPDEGLQFLAKIGHTSNKTGAMPNWN